MVHLRAARCSPRLQVLHYSSEHFWTIDRKLRLYREMDWRTPEFPKRLPPYYWVLGQSHRQSIMWLCTFCQGWVRSHFKHLCLADPNYFCDSVNWCEIEWNTSWTCCLCYCPKQSTWIHYLRKGQIIFQERLGTHSYRSQCWTVCGVKRITSQILGPWRDRWGSGSSVQRKLVVWGSFC